MRKLKYLPPLMLLALLSLPVFLSADNWIRVRWISDGDTIGLEGGQRVRYNGINAPEIAHADRGQSAEPYGDAAKRFNIKLVTGKKVRLEFDTKRRDRYGRLLAYVFLLDGTFVNAEMVANGMAYFLAGSVNKKYGKLLFETQRKAMTAGKGMWRDLSQKGENYIGNRRSKRFHLKSCPFAQKIATRNRTTFANSRDAFWAGYAPAKRCIEISKLIHQKKLSQ